MDEQKRKPVPYGPLAFIVVLLVVFMWTSGGNDLIPNLPSRDLGNSGATQNLAMRVVYGDWVWRWGVPFLLLEISTVLTFILANQIKMIKTNR